MRTKDGSTGLMSAETKKYLMHLGLPKRLATDKIRNALVTASRIPNIDPCDNNYFRIEPHGRLDDNHMSNVFIKLDGLNEIFQSGNDPLSVQIRTLSAALLRIVAEKVEKARA